MLLKINEYYYLNLLFSVYYVYSILGVTVPILNFAAKNKTLACSLFMINLRYVIKFECN
jgi:hypothetical protein